MLRRGFIGKLAAFMAFLCGRGFGVFGNVPRLQGGVEPSAAPCGRKCHGNGEDHCCWIEGRVCRYLEENTVPGRRWACGLYRELGSWPAVYADARHIHLRTVEWRGTFAEGMLCGDWPQKFPVTSERRCCYETRES